MKKIKILMIFIVFLFILSFCAIDISNKQLAYEASKKAQAHSNSGMVSSLKAYENDPYYQEYMRAVTNPLEIVENVMEAFGPDGYLNAGY